MNTKYGRSTTQCLKIQQNFGYFLECWRSIRDDKNLKDFAWCVRERLENEKVTKVEAGFYYWLRNEEKNDDID